MNNKPLLQCDALVHVYQEENHQVPVLTGAEFQLNAGEMLKIVGHSGSGKKYVITSFRDFGKCKKVLSLLRVKT